MNKRRITLNLDADVVEALRAIGGGSISAIANEALRESLQRKAHQVALLEWLAELNDRHGAPGNDDYTEAATFLDALEQGRDTSAGAA